jgi:hypothetical protein
MWNFYTYETQLWENTLLDALYAIFILAFNEDAPLNRTWFVYSESTWQHIVLSFKIKPKIYDKQNTVNNKVWIWLSYAL